MGAVEVDFGRRDDLRADCANCSGLCCVLTSFTASADFAFDRPAGTPCIHLDTRHACTVHADLRELGFRGCTVFDCFGAGQQVSQRTFAGRSWRDSAEVRAAQLAVFPVVLGLHELLWYLRQAVELTRAHDAHAELVAVHDEVQEIAEWPADRLEKFDVLALFAAVRPLLADASAHARSAAAPAPATHGGHLLGPGADLSGADLSGADLRNVDLSDCTLAGADLTRTRMNGCDVLGAGLRAADVSGADLAGALYLTQTQLNSTRGDRATVLPAGFVRPSHWA